VPSALTPISGPANRSQCLPVSSQRGASPSSLRAIGSRSPRLAATITRVSAPLGARCTRSGGVILLDLDAVAAPAGTAWHAGCGGGRPQLVAQEVRSYLLAQRTAEVIPTVAALRTWPSEVVDLELQRLDVRLPALDPVVRIPNSPALCTAWSASSCIRPRCGYSNSQAPLAARPTPMRYGPL
jgi:hypothetical protein